MSADVAILIVTYNSSRQIHKCLASVYEQRAQVSQQIVVVDNGSTDGTVSAIREQFHEISLVLPGKNLGFAAGVNLAARHADAEFLLLLNPDTAILDHAVDRIVAFARSRPAYGLYGGRAFKPDGALEPSSCWGLPTLWSLVMFASGLSTAAKGNAMLDPESLGEWSRDTVREVGMLSGSFLLVRRALWQQLGGLDERYFMYGEDADLATRAKLAGYPAVLCPEATFVHEVGQSADTPLHKAIMLHRGKATYIRAHWAGARRRLGLGLLLCGVGVRAAATALARVRTGERTRNRPWIALWRQRSDWITGYPPCAVVRDEAGRTERPLVTA